MLEANQEDDEEQGNKKEKNTNYGSIATAISVLQQRGVKIELPDINNAKMGFTPNEKNNSILFGLKGISKINSEVARTIIENRPYASFNDFKERLVDTKREVVGKDGKAQNKAYVTNNQLISLIKAGAFDSLEAGRSREELMKDYLLSIFKPKKAISKDLMKHIVEVGLVPNDYMEQVRHYHFREYLKGLPFTKASSSTKWATVKTGSVEMDNYTTHYFETHFMNELNEDRDYRYNENGDLEILLGTKRQGSFDSIHAQKIKELTEWLKSEHGLGAYNQLLFQELYLKHAEGTISKWEMDALSFYYHEHECDALQLDDFNVANFNALSEEPTVLGLNQQGYPYFQLSVITGAVLDKDNNKHSITLLTQNGVVTVKFQAGQYNYYAKVISSVDETTGAKTTLEDGWFSKGTLLMISGYRSGQVFRAKSYANGIIKHSCQRIRPTGVNGMYQLFEERVSY